tara:strand:- start:941 stop:1213 length:273 start_codon:yes stop_codon:yes gene_type:complete
MTKVEKFEKLIKGIKFTPAQQKIVDKLLRGYEIQVVNPHHMNGGTMMWKSPYSSSLEWAGKVYKAFYNVGWKLKKEGRVGEYYMNQFVNQ